MAFFSGVSQRLKGAYKRLGHNINGYFIENFTVLLSMLIEERRYFQMSQLQQPASCCCTSALQVACELLATVMSANPMLNMCQKRV